MIVRFVQLLGVCTCLRGLDLARSGTHMQHARAELRKHSLHPLQLHRFVHTSQRVNAAGGGSTPTPVPNTAQSHAALLAALADGPVGVAKHLQLRAGLAGPQNTTSAPAAARTRFLAILLQVGL